MSEYYEEDKEGGCEVMRLLAGLLRGIKETEPMQEAVDRMITISTLTKPDLQ